MLVSKANISGNRRVYLYYMINPPTGTQTIAITGSSPATNETAASYSNCSQNTQVDASNLATGNSTSPSGSVSTVNANSLVVAALGYDTSAAVSSPSNFNSIADDSANSASIYSGDSGNNASPTSVTQNATVGSTSNWAVIQASIAPFAPQKVRKPADQIVTNSTTLQNDNDLDVWLTSTSTSYVVDSELFVTASSTGDIVVELRRREQP